MLGLLSIEPLHVLPEGIVTLCEQARRQDFRFLDRLIRAWDTGTNRFNAKGETLLGAFRAGDLVAVGGLNIDRYADDPKIARIRHLYVLNDLRRQGVGAAIVGRLLVQLVIPASPMSD